MPELRDVGEELFEYEERHGDGSCGGPPCPLCVEQAGKKLRLSMQKIEAHGSLIVLIARDESNQRWTVHVPFKPYFYVPEDEVKKAEEKGLKVEFGHTGVLEYGRLVPVARVYCDSPAEVPRRRKGFTRTWEAGIPYPRRFMIDAGLYENFEITVVTGVNEPPRGVCSDMSNRVVLASGIEAIRPLADPVKAKKRLLHYDIETNKYRGEWSDKLEAMGQVTCVTFHDNYPETFTTLIWHPRHQGKPKIEERTRYSHAYKREVPWRVIWYANETEMLLAWVQYLKVNRPDGLAAWNGHQGFQRRNDGGYDAPYLINRLNRVGIGAHQMSPLGSTFAGFQGNKGGKNGPGLWKCTIDGVQLYDLMTIYQIKEGGFVGTVDFSGLKPVAQKFAKIPMKKDPANLESWWEHETEEFLNYSFLDVDAIVTLDKKEGYVAFADGLQHFCGVEDANVVFRPATLVSTLEKRIAKDRGVCVPTNSGDGEDANAPLVVGGRVLDPRRWGLMREVAVFDFNRMYIAIIQSANIGYETVVYVTLQQQNCAHASAEQWSAFTHPSCPCCSPDTQIEQDAHKHCPDCKFVFCPTMIRVPITPEASDHFITAALEKRDPGLLLKGVVCFRQNERGVQPENLDRLQTLRDTYDVRIKKAKDAAEKEELKRQRTPVKSLLLTAYGAMLNAFNDLYSVPCGSAVTGLGRTLHEFVDRFTCRLLGDPTAVFYGDTDSEFTIVPEGDDALSFGKWLEGHMNEALNDFARSLGMQKHHFRIELQEIFNGYMMGPTKKRYAGFVTWMEGVPQNPPHLLVHGLEGIKSDAAPITEEVTDKALRAILSGTPPEEVLGYVRSMYESIASGDIPLREVVRSINLNFNIDKDDKSTNIIEAAKEGREKYGFTYPVGGRVTVVKLARGGNWIAVPEGEDIPEGMAVDWQYHAEAAVLNPLKGIFKWIDLGDQIQSILLGSKPTRQRRLF